MIFELEVTNFRSIKHTQTISFFAENKKENKMDLLSFKKSKILQTMVFYGKNSSGKTNILKAFQNLRKMVIHSSNFDTASPIEFYDPFLFTQEKNKPTIFKLLFEVNEQKYSYRFSYDEKSILEEELLIYKTAKPTKLFERKGNNYLFSPEYESIKDLIDRTHNNKLFLSVASQWAANKKEINDIYNFFRNDIIYFQKNYNDPSMEFTKRTTDLLTDDPEAQIFLKKMIKYFNLEMTDIKADTISIDMKNAPAEIRTFLEHIQKGKQMGELKADSIQSSYLVDNKDYLLDFTEESNGTRKLYDLFSILYSGLNSKKFILIDEIEMGLHTTLAKAFIDLFQNLFTNTHNSQLVFTTHDTSMLDLNLLRRDQIWFASKSKENQLSTNIFRLSSFAVRLTSNIVKNYLNGKYANVPSIPKWN